MAIYGLQVHSASIDEKENITLGFTTDIVIHFNGKITEKLKHKPSYTLNPVNRVNLNQHYQHT